MNNFDKKNWQKLNFGEIAKEVRVAEHEPLKNGLKRYIGLEHIESENLHISSWGDISDGTTFSRKFVKGQVLFGRRRAYLKKAALVDFDGICSGDILVFEAIQGKLLPELLPFIVQNDKFFQHAVDASAGSLSPRVKFKDLAKFELMLPKNLDEQKKLADFLWAGDELIQKYSSLKRLFDTYIEIALSSFKSKNLVKLSDLSSVITKGTTPTTGGDEFLDLGINFFKVESFTDSGEIIENKVAKISETVHSKQKRSILMEGDILFSIAGYIGRTILVSKKILPANTNQAFGIIRLKNEFAWLKRYIFVFLKSSFAKDYFSKLSTQTAQANINLEQLGSIKIPLISKDDVEEIEKKYIFLEKTKYKLLNCKENIIQIEKNVSKEIFS